jgi:hypothetical protein
MEQFLRREIDYNGENVQLIDIFCYLGGFLYNTGGWSKPEH